ncbi:MAG TPA: hypothetical protein VIV11_43490 [Kofleriaceae bacterium]
MTAHKTLCTVLLSVAAVGCASDPKGPPIPDDDPSVRAWILAYKAAHPGQHGDINAKTPEQVAADPDAQRLLGLCPTDQRPVIPLLAWEYGGADHAWIAPDASALVYCVYIPSATATESWHYDAAMDRVTADMWIRLIDENPCRDKTGADQVIACIGDPTNFEIIVDLASLHDGADVGLSLSEASTDLMLRQADGSRVHLLTNL